MKFPEYEQKVYELYKGNLHYQASMFESFLVNGYKEIEGRAGATKEPP